MDCYTHVTDKAYLSVIILRHSNLKKSNEAHMLASVTVAPAGGVGVGQKSPLIHLLL